MSGYYDTEATVYDESRGGADRARAAADAVERLVGPAPQYGVAVDVGGGTGIVAAEVATRGWSVVVIDASLGMLHLAHERLPGRAAVADAAQLPLAAGSVDLVTTIWLLHLLPTGVADQVIAEASRVLRPDGHLVTTVDKHRAHGRAPRGDADDRGHVVEVAGRLGLAPVGETWFSGRSDWGSATERDPAFATLALRRSAVVGFG